MNMNDRLISHEYQPVDKVRKTLAGFYIALAVGLMAAWGVSAAMAQVCQSPDEVADIVEMQVGERLPEVRLDAKQAQAFFAATGGTADVPFVFSGASIFFAPNGAALVMLFENDCAVLSAVFPAAAVKPLLEKISGTPA